MQDSLLHSPKILFLDEPTIELDALSKLTVRKFISELNKKNKTTIILTTHDMQDIEAITERIILIDKCKNPALKSIAYSDGDLRVRLPIK